MADPSVFISYTHDSAEHRQRVLGLCRRLRSEGVDCDIDRHHPSPAEGWPSWMRRSIHDADFVLVICSEPYRRRFDGDETPGTGRGAIWEGVLVTADLYQREGRNQKYVPVVFSADDRAHIPEPLTAATFYDLSTDVGYEQLYRRLTDQPEVPRVALGTRVALPPLDVRWEQAPAAPAATIAFRSDLEPDEVSVYEALPAIERGEPVAVRWPAVSDELHDLLSARRPQLAELLVERGTPRGPQLLYGVEQFDLSLAEARRRRDRAAERIPLMLAGMRDPGWWGSTVLPPFAAALQRFLVLANAHALVDLGSILFETDARPLPGGLGPRLVNSELFQVPAVAEALGARPPFWNVDVRIGDRPHDVFAPRETAERASDVGAARAGSFMRDCLVPQVEQRLIGGDALVAYHPDAVTVVKVRDERWNEV